MEFFRTVNRKTNEENIQSSLTLKHLDRFSNEIFIIGDQNENEAFIGGVWGEFTLSRSTINGGLRFALTECPNALAWTITTGYPPDPESIIIHLTINRQEKNSDFLEEITEFLDDHCACLDHLFKV